MPAPITLKQLLETGVHFGHRTQKWNPKMEPYIFTQRNGIHILDLRLTLKNLHKYYDMVRDTVMDGGTVMFVGTKRQAQESISRAAESCGMPYVTYRWLGGTLTNWRTIRERIETLKKLETRRDKGEFDLLTKREALSMERKILKLQTRLGGIRDMKKLPDIIVVIDTHREVTAVKEANILNIPVLALLDTNCNPDPIEYIIPANDDAMRSINLLVNLFAEAVREGQAMSKRDDEVEMPVTAGAVEFDEEQGSDEAYLGESTLAKLRDAKLFDEKEKEEAETATATETEAKTETETETEATEQGDKKENEG
jgi:small subunit ribosomal protein S2